MATRNQQLNLHKVGEIDWIDALLSPVFLISTLAFTEAVTFTFNWISFDLNEVLWSGSGAEITMAMVLGLGCLAVAYGTNQISVDDWNQTETAIVAGVVVLHFAIAFVPAISDLVLQNVWVGVIVVLVNSAGYALVAYY